MKRFNHLMLGVEVCLLFVVGAYGQVQRPARVRAEDTGTTDVLPGEPASPETSTVVARGAQAVVPRLMKFSGVLHDTLGKPLSGPVDVTFALYSTEAGGNPLWFETQSVQADELGRYTALLGAMHADGLPIGLFTSGEVRWLGIQVGSETEQQPRVLLVSVPYALKAGDAETLGGKPASAYVLSDAMSGSTANSSAGSTTSTATAAGSGKTQKARTSNTAPLTPVCSSLTSNSGGTLNTIAMFNGTCDVENSIMTRSGNNIGIGTASPTYSLDITGPSNASVRLSGAGTHQFTIAGATSGRLGEDAAGFFFSSDTNGGAVRFLTNNGSLHEWMRLNSAGNVGIGTTTPVAKLDVVGNVNIPPTATGGSMGVISLGGTAFMHACCGNVNGNAFLGFGAGSLSATGSSNSAVGSNALASNPGGSGNTAIGGGSLQSSTGSYLTAVGYYSGYPLYNPYISAGQYDTYIGYNTGPAAASLNNASALGAYSVVGENNALVLGSVNGQNGATSNVNVGIGTTTPYTSLHIRNDASGALGPTLTLMNGGGNSGASASIDLDTYDPGAGVAPAVRIQDLDDNWSGDLTFSTKTPGSNTNSLVEQVRISNYGSLIVDSSHNNSGSLSSGAAAGTGLVFGGAGSGEGIASDRGTSLGQQYSLGFYTGGVQRMVIYNGGVVQMNVGLGISQSGLGYGFTLNGNGQITGCLVVSGSSSGTCVSDARLKANIEPFPNALDKLVKLQPVHFDYRAKEFPAYHLPEGQMTGLIAQQVEKVFPNMVSTDSNGFRRVDYGQLPYLLLEGERELKARNDALHRLNKTQQAEIVKLEREVRELKQEQTEIAALKARLDRLEAAESATARTQDVQTGKGKESGNTPMARGAF